MILPPYNYVDKQKIRLTKWYLCKKLSIETLILTVSLFNDMFHKVICFKSAMQVFDQSTQKVTAMQTALDIFKHCQI